MWSLSRLRENMKFSWAKWVLCNVIISTVVIIYGLDYDRAEQAKYEYLQVNGTISEMKVWATEHSQSLASTVHLWLTFDYNGAPVTKQVESFRTLNLISLEIGDFYSAWAVIYDGTLQDLLYNKCPVTPHTIWGLTVIGWALVLPLVGTAILGVTRSHGPEPKAPGQIFESRYVPLAQINIKDASSSTDSAVTV